MGQLTVEGIKYDNPQQVPQSQVLFQADSTDLNNPSQTAGQPWQPNVSTIKAIVPGTSYYGWGTESYPKPDPLVLVPPPQANPVMFNQDPPVVGRGQAVSVSGSAGSTGNPSVDVNRKVSGTIPGTNCTIRNPG